MTGLPSPLPSFSRHDGRRVCPCCRTIRAVARVMRACHSRKPPATDLAGARAWRSRSPGDRKDHGRPAIPTSQRSSMASWRRSRDGETTITREVGGQSATARVVVTGIGRPFEWSFRNHVEPMLAKIGCNSGACHGALAGKGGFRLSLRGYDPADRLLQHRQAGSRPARRALRPGRSLVLAKPTGAIAHKGGIRFATDSLEYRILAEWLATARRPPETAMPASISSRSFPRDRSTTSGQVQQILVRARYSRWADRRRHPLGEMVVYRRIRMPGRRAR